MNTIIPDDVESNLSIYLIFQTDSDSSDLSALKDALCVVRISLKSSPFKTDIHWSPLLCPVILKFPLYTSFIKQLP